MWCAQLSSLNHEYPQLFSFFKWFDQEKLNISVVLAQLKENYGDVCDCEQWGFPAGYHSTSSLNRDKLCVFFILPGLTPWNTRLFILTVYFSLYFLFFAVSHLLYLHERKEYNGLARDRLVLVFLLSSAWLLLLDCSAWLLKQPCLLRERIREVKVLIW